MEAAFGVLEMPILLELLLLSGELMGETWLLLSPALGVAGTETDEFEVLGAAKILLEFVSTRSNC